MGGTIIIFVGVLVAFALLWIVFYKKDHLDQEKIDRYVCHTCGEKHCDCHKVDDELEVK